MSRWDAIEIVLAFHRESPRGLAWLVSIDGDERRAVWIPKALSECLEACGELERMDERCQRLRIGRWLVSMPAFLALEKGLIEG